MINVSTFWVPNMSDNVVSHKYISKTEFLGEHHILDISELTYKNLDDKSVFDYLNKKQTPGGANH